MSLATDPNGQARPATRPRSGLPNLLAGWAGLILGATVFTFLFLNNWGLTIVGIALWLSTWAWSKWV